MIEHFSMKHFPRWVHEFLNKYNQGLDVLLDYLMTSLEVMR